MGILINIVWFVARTILWAILLITISRAIRGLVWMMKDAREALRNRREKKNTKKNLIKIKRYVSAN